MGLIWPRFVPFGFFSLPTWGAKTGEKEWNPCGNWRRKWSFTFLLSIHVIINHSSALRRNMLLRRCAWLIELSFSPRATRALASRFITYCSSRIRQRAKRFNALVLIAANCPSYFEIIAGCARVWDSRFRCSSSYAFLFHDKGGEIE